MTAITRKLLRNIRSKKKIRAYVKAGRVHWVLAHAVPVVTRHVLRPRRVLCQHRVPTTSASLRIASCRYPEVALISCNVLTFGDQPGYSRLRC